MEYQAPAPSCSDAVNPGILRSDGTPFRSLFGTRCGTVSTVPDLWAVSESLGLISCKSDTDLEECTWARAGRGLWGIVIRGCAQ